MTGQHPFVDKLALGDPDVWSYFVDNYSSLILSVVRRYNADHDACMDAYTYILEELAAGDMRRLKHYGRAGVARPSRFGTWLKLVVRNLYFDWFRHRFGRKSVPAEVQKLGDVGQSIFKVVYWQNYPPRQAFEVVRGQYPDLSYTDFLGYLSEVDGRLTGINRAKIRRDRMKALKPASLDVEREHGPPVETQALVERPAADAPGLRQEAAGLLLELLDELPAEDRLLLRLRFHEALTAPEIARVLNVPDPASIYRRLDRLCRALGKRAAATGVAARLQEDAESLTDLHLGWALSPERSPES